jgi:heterotetrameric sarcosine oxidase gamma subunit
VSAPELVPAPAVRLRACRSDVVEIAPRQGSAAQCTELARGRGFTLPAPNRVAIGPGGVALCVRPQRWLMLSRPAAPGQSARAWQEALGGIGTAVDQSAGLAALVLEGAAAAELLAGACRLDLHPRMFPPGHAAATVMVQVATVLAALPGGLLLLTPASTAQHLREWLTAAAEPFGLVPQSQLEEILLGDESA